MNDYYPIPQWIKRPGSAITDPWERPDWVRVPKTEPDPFEGCEKVFQGQRAIDILGREVYPGDKIAVAVTAGRSADMRVGTILSIDEILEDDWTNGGKRGTGKYRIKCEWEQSAHYHIRASSVEAGLPKYIKL